MKNVEKKVLIFRSGAQESYSPRSEIWIGHNYPLLLGPHILAGEDFRCIFLWEAMPKTREIFFIFFVGGLNLLRNKWGLSQFIARELYFCVDFLFRQ